MSNKFGVKLTSKLTTNVGKRKVSVRRSNETLKISFPDVERLNVIAVNPFENPRTNNVISNLNSFPLLRWISKSTGTVSNRIPVFNPDFLGDGSSNFPMRRTE